MAVANWGEIAEFALSERERAAQNNTTISRILDDTAITLRHFTGEMERLAAGYANNVPVANAAEKLADLIATLTDTQYELCIQCTQATLKSARADALDNILNW